MKKYAIGIPVLVILLVALSCFMMSYHATYSQTVQNSTVASSSGSSVQNQAQRAVPPATAVVIEGNDRLTNSLRAYLKQGLETVPGLGQVQFLDQPTEQAGLPLIYIQIKEQRVNWTPVYSTATLQTQVSYASTGDVTFRDTSPTHFKTTSPTDLQFDGNFTLADKSWGWMSLPGYDDLLAQALANNILQSLQKQMQ